MTVDMTWRSVPQTAKQPDLEMVSGAMPADAPAIRTIAMPADTNPAGDVFGGWLMCQMDLAGGNAATRCARGRCVTVAANSISFQSPVKVGDEVSVWAQLIGIGRTSMKFRVSAWCRAADGGRTTKVTEAEFTYVALDSDGRPRPIEASALSDMAGR